MSRQLVAVENELALWRKERLFLPLWWRDDDATSPSPALDRLLDLTERLGATPHLSIVPKNADARLAQRLKGTDAVVLTHGWQHSNHAPEGEKKAEFGAHRPVGVMLEDMARGRSRTQQLFGSRALPVFVPPWNRICGEAIEGLSPCGFVALSAFGPRRPTDAIVRVNAHLDPVDWHGSRGLSDPAVLEAKIASVLAERRLGRDDNSEPLGLLTHHLVHDEVIWSFVTALVSLLLDSNIAGWADPFAGR